MISVRLRPSLLALCVAGACGVPPRSFPTAPGVRLVVDTTCYEAEGVTRRQWMASMHQNAQTAHGARQGAVLIMPGVRLTVDTTYRDMLP